MRFRLLTFLLLVPIIGLILGLILGEALRERTNSEILISIYSSDPTMEFESDISPLQPFLDQMDAPPTEELLDYLENWIPKTDHEFYTGRFDNIRTMEQNSVNCAPDYTVIPFGFFPIADEWEGCKYAYCVHDRCVYYLGYLDPGDVNSVDDVRNKASKSWPSLNAFLLAVEQEKID